MNPLIEDQVIIPASTRTSQQPILFRGIGHAVGKNPLVMSVVRASPLAYSTEPKAAEVDPNPFIIGDEISLISAFQTKKQTRILFVGSLDFFSDQFITTELTLPNGKKLVLSSPKKNAYH
jgi:oligosaccharyltransferase complex subunit beta